MKKPLLRQLFFIFGLAIATFVIAAPDQPTGDPVAGRSLYRSYCATCHGYDAVGDGPMAQHLRVAPTDLSQMQIDNDGIFPEGELFDAIASRRAVAGHGSEDMPVWGDVFTKVRGGQWKGQEAQKIANVVAYLRMLQVPSTKK